MRSGFLRLKSAALLVTGKQHEEAGDNTKLTPSLVLVHLLWEDKLDAAKGGEAAIYRDHRSRDKSRCRTHQPQQRPYQIFWRA